MIDLYKLKKIYFVGIKGVAMASLALCAKDLGIEVSGSDISEEFVTDETLRSRKIYWDIGFTEKYITDDIDLVITTGAHGGLANPQCVFAEKRGIKVITHAEALGLFSKGKEVLSVCGVGGKTTTSSMIASTMQLAGENPSFAIGVGNIYPINTPGKYSKASKYFICEADEYAVSPGINNNPRFLYLDPKVLVVTNIEYDHPDIYKNIKETQSVFLEFINRTKKDGRVIIYSDNPNNKIVFKDIKVPYISYGFEGNPEYKIVDVEKNKTKVMFSLQHNNKIETKLKIKVFGNFNIANAAACYIAMVSLGLKKERIAEYLAKFSGTKRRFEYIGKNSKGAYVLDDYAHHPFEIESVIKLAKEHYPKKNIVTIFQPHTYSRTKSLFNQFAQKLALSDSVLVMDIYSSAREKPDPKVNSLLLVEEIKKLNKNVIYTKKADDVIKWLSINSNKNDLILTLGAGSIFHLHKKILRI